MQTGDRCRIDIPDENDPDHKLHGQHGVVVRIIEDGAGSITGHERDDNLYRIKLENEDRTVDLRARDLRPPIE